MLLEVAPRGFEEFRPAEHLVDRRRQPSAERRLSKPWGATSGSISARLISRAAMDGEMNPSRSKGQPGLRNRHRMMAGGSGEREACWLAGWSAVTAVSLND